MALPFNIKQEDTMRHRMAAAVALLAFVLTPCSADAEGKAQKGKGPTGPQVGYFDLSSSIFSELGAEAILKETRQGATLTSAELDVCHLTSPTATRLDRFVVPLKVEGNRLTGTAQSQEAKQAVSVSLTRRAAGSNFTFEGTITSGKFTDKIQSSDNTELPETDITEQYLTEPAIESAPADFTAAWPQTLYVRVARNGLSGLLDALREQNVRVVFNSLQTSCLVLRTGRFTVQIDVDAERIGAVLAKLKSVPGLAEIGFSPNGPNMQRAIRFPSTSWRDAAGKLDRDKLAAALGTALSEAMSATVNATTWDAVMGELVVELKRPDETVAGLKLTQQISVTMVVAPESLASNQQSILWIETVTGRMLDERAPPRLTFSQAPTEDAGEGQPAEPEGSEGLPNAVARALKGVLWDIDKERWRP
jgi:hypothetical protein